MYRYNINTTEEEKIGIVFINKSYTTNKHTIIDENSNEVGYDWSEEKKTLKHSLD